MRQRSAGNTERGMFGITTAEDFFQKVCTDYERATENIGDPYAAMNCILSLYHLHEWVWWCWLEGRDEVLSSLGIRNDEEEFRRLLGQKCPHFDLLRELANDTKHSASKNANGGSTTLNLWLVTAKGHMGLARMELRIFSLT